MPDNPYTHFVRLYPQGNYFFGGENYSDSEQRAFYFQKSRKFPQQTSLLGLIRYQLLLQNKMLVSDKGRRSIASPKAPALIGDQSFAPLPKESKIIPSFGAIDALSPVMLIHQDGRRYMPFPAFKDWEQAESKWPKDEHQYHQPALKETPISVKASLTMGAPMNMPSFWKGYEVKKGMEWGFRNLDDESFLAEKEVFEETDSQIGIYKSQKLKHRREKDQSEREGFFKMKYVRMRNGFGFGFYLRLDLPSEFNFGSQSAVIFGKERSVFLMQVESLSASPQRVPTNQPSLTSGSKLCLASPARLDLNKVYAYCSTVITREISFRCMDTSIQKTKNYHGRLSRNNKAGNPGLSARYNLVDSGSLLVLRDALSTEDLDQLSDRLYDPIFSAIGYNHYLTY